VILHHTVHDMRFKPALDAISQQMAQIGVSPQIINDAVNLAIEDADVYDLLIRWASAPDDVEQDEILWLIGDRLDDYRAVFGRIPSLQWLRGLTAWTQRDPAIQA
jgi:hypothetical protein